MSTANRVIKNTAFLYAKMGVTMFISLYTTRLILNSLGTTDFGIFNIVGGAIAMLGFLNTAMAGATQRFMSFSEGEGNQEKKKKVFNISLVLHFGIAIIVGIALLLTGYIFFNGVLNITTERIFAAKVVYGSLIVSTVFTIMAVPYDAILNAHENMLYYSIIGIIESVLKLIVAIVVVNYTGDKLIIYGMMMSCVPLIIMIVMRIYCHKKYAECSISVAQNWDFSLMKEMTNFAGWNFLGVTSGLLGNYGNGIVMNHFFGTTVNAALGVAAQLNGQLMAFSNNLIKAVSPIIIKKEGESNRESMIKYSFSGSKLSFYIFSFFAIPSIIEAPTILKLWLNVIPEWSIIFFQYQLIRTLIEQLTSLFSTSLSAIGSIKELNLITAFFDLLTMPTLYVLFHLGFSPYWYYWVIIIFMVLIVSGVKIYYCIKFCGLVFQDFVSKILFPSLLICGVSFLAGYTISNCFSESYLKLGACFLSTSMTLISFAILYFDENEKKIFFSIFNMFKAKIKYIHK
ncbi:Na+-driven multidrug efflux pump [Arcicella aurantiaca]|uniref:Na+-driven multidrug efflux pump n=1 Tax=Arcicella aurantiaca TaxID=591202 RepID=A0A316DXD9_9BACT|nr:hypothetical protein [Arcicella aurantiaca]PWK22396.1 Na+-driven multidrug efflux pump [Arcicella aurantiaca]